MRLSPEMSTLHQTSHWTLEIKRNGESAQKHTARKKQWGRWWLLLHQKQKARRKWDIKTLDLPKILDLVIIIFFLPKIYFYHFSEGLWMWAQALEFQVVSCPVQVLRIKQVFCKSSTHSFCFFIEIMSLTPMSVSGSPQFPCLTMPCRKIPYILKTKWRVKFHLENETGI